MEFIFVALILGIPIVNFIAIIHKLIDVINSIKTKNKKIKAKIIHLVILVITFITIIIFYAYINYQLNEAIANM